MTPQQPQELDKGELRRTILRRATVRSSEVIFSQTMGSNGVVLPPKMSHQEIVEIGIDDLMQLITQHDIAFLESVRKTGIPGFNRGHLTDDYIAGFCEATRKWRQAIGTKIKSLTPTERYLCQSYYDDNNVLQDCT